MIEGRKRVVPLASNDPLIWEAPLVGVWTYGLELPSSLAGAEMNRFEKEELKASLLRNPLVWAALCRFLFCRHFKDRYSASQGKNTFLLINFFKNSQNAQFLEFRVNSVNGRPDGNWGVLSYNSEVRVDPKTGAFPNFSLTPSCDEEKLAKNAKADLTVVKKYFERCGLGSAGPGARPQSSGSAKAASLAGASLGANNKSGGRFATINRESKRRPAPSHATLGTQDTSNTLQTNLSSTLDNRKYQGASASLRKELPAGTSSMQTTSSRGAARSRNSRSISKPEGESLDA